MNLNRVYAIAARKFASLKRDHRTFAFIIVMPAIQILLFGVAIGQSPTGLDITILDNDATDVDDDLSRVLSGSETFVIHEEYSTTADARTAIEGGEIWAAIVISDNGTIEVHLDNSNQQVSSTIMVEVRNALTTILEEQGASLPLNIADPVYGENTLLDHCPSIYIYYRFK